MALTTDQYREQLIASGLLNLEEVSSILSSLPSDKQPRDGEQLARELVRQKKLTRYQAEQIYTGKGKMLILGNYVVLDKLGQGGMGVVLKAEHKRLKRLVALKVMSANIVRTPDALKRFHREVEAAAKLRHNNVVATDDADEAKGTHFLVMEYVEGSDLSVLVKKNGPLSVSQAVDCILQAARGLEYAHSQGVVHRDIKPANLLLDARGTVKILDMGLARIEGATGSQGELTTTGAVMGTVDYMAPEQAISTKHADARSDIYSLGISLWYLLTGKCAYDGDTLMSKLLAHRDSPIPSLCNVDPEIPTSVDAVFRKMVAKQAQDRHQSMTEVIRDLELCQSGSTSVTNGAIAGNDEDPGLQSFLSSLGTAPASIAATQLIAAPVMGATVNSANEATIINGNIDINPDSRTVTSENARERQRKKNRRTEATPAVTSRLHRNPRVLLGAAAAAIILLVAIVILIQTPHGTLRLEILDPEVEVTIKGTELTLRGADIEPLSLTTGEKKLVITRGDLLFETDSFTLRKGTETRVRVELLGERLVVNGDGRVIGDQPISHNGPTNSIVADDPVTSTSPAAITTAPPLAIAPFQAAQARAHQEAWAKHFGVPVEYTNSIGMRFTLIPPGEFTMGSSAEDINAALMDVPDDPNVHWTRAIIQSESPRHKAVLSQPFYMGVFEVTQAQYERVMGTNPSYFSPHGQSSQAVAGMDTTSFPVDNVSWNDAAECCARLSLLEGYQPFYARDGENVSPLDGTGYQLPTEAEWEFACRAGTTTRFWNGDRNEDLAESGWYHENAGGRTHRVGELAANPFGLYDVHGNAWEWIRDGWRNENHGYAAYTQKREIDPYRAFTGCSDRMLRGGFWFHPPSGCRSSSRHAFIPSSPSPNVGFRMSLSVSAVKLALARGNPQKQGE